MITEKDILARLANGEDAQKIANEIASVLNGAIEKYENEKQAQIKAAKHKADKERAAKQALEIVLNFIEEYYPDIYDEELRQATGAEIVLACDEGLEAINKAHATMTNIEKLMTEVEEIKKNTGMDPFEKFLTEFVDN